MRRKLAAAAMAAGLFAVAACSDDGGESTAEVCERMEVEGTPAMDRFVDASQQAATAIQTNDQAAALVAVTEAQNAASEFVDVLRDGADSAADADLSSALDSLADEMEAYLGSLNVNDLVAGEQPDSSGVDAAADSVDEICEA